MTYRATMLFIGDTECDVTPILVSEDDDVLIICWNKRQAPSRLNQLIGPPSATKIRINKPFFRATERMPGFHTACNDAQSECAEDW